MMTTGREGTMTRMKLKGLVLVLWPFLFLACVAYQRQTYDFESGPPEKTLAGDVLAVQTRAGEYYRFREDRPAKADPTQIVGYAMIPKEVPLEDVANLAKNDLGEIVGYTDTKGQRHRTLFGIEKDNVLLAYLPEGSFHQVSIPYSDIGSVTLRTQRATAAGTVVLVILGVVAVVAIIGLAASSGRQQHTHPNQESCPFIYSFDSQEYVLDGEPYGGAICPGFKRTEWLALDHLRAVDSRYRLLVTNELQEREHTDELKLVVVDHPKDALVVPDTWGGLHTFSKPQAAVRATDAAGRDVRSFVSAADGYYWLGHPEAIDPQKPDSFRDSLTFEFPKPAGAKRVKLLANAWTTHQGSASAQAVLALHGRDLDKFYQGVNSHGPDYGRLTSFYVNEEMYMLKIWVETPAGWRARGLIYGGGPFVAKEKAYVLDVSDVPEETLRVRLNPPLDFWMLDRLAVDYAPDLDLRAREIAPATAIDQDGRDVRDLLAANDGSCYEMPNSGDRAELTFAAPPESEGLARTVLLKASGYYDINLEARGEPQTELLNRIYNEPGFALRYTYEWRQRTLYAQARALVH
jgi:hypothetical protein